MSAGVKCLRLTTESVSDRNFRMLRRRSLAVTLLMVVLTFAPSLARAASVCAPDWMRLSCRLIVAMNQKRLLTV